MFSTPMKSRVATPTAIVDEGGEDLASKILTRPERERRRIEIPVLFLGLVELL